MAPMIVPGPRFTTPLAAGLLAAALAAGAAERGIDQLREVVDAACDCAAGRASGLDAALHCTRGPRDFGRIKVARRDAWSEEDGRRAARLERLIEYCIANAMSAADARDLLGLPVPPGAAAAPLMRWRRIAPADLADHRTRLVRVEDGRGERVKGLVEAVSGDTLMLRRARRDGGGIERMPFESIRGAWIMELP